MPTRKQIAFARHSPLGLAQYYWPKKPDSKFYFAAHKTTIRLNRAFLKLHDPEDPITTLVVSQPPRTGKSSLVAQIHPPWYLGRWPERNALVTGYSNDLCKRFGGFGRNLLEEHGKELFRVEIDDSYSAKDEWQTTKGGGMKAVSIRGQITGYGFNHITIDDPYSNYEEAHSQRQRDKVWKEIGAAVDTRAEEPFTQCVIQTRWHPDDVAGRYHALAENGDDSILVLNMPAYAEEDLFYGENEDQAGELFARKGEYLFEWQWNKKKLESWRRKHGDYMYHALFQGRPTTPEDVFWNERLFEDIWFDEWPEEKYLFVAIDPAAGAEVTLGCDSAIVASSTTYGEKYYIDADLAPSGPVETVKRLEAFIDKLPRIPDALGIEKNSTQVQSMEPLVRSMLQRRGWRMSVFEIPLKRNLGKALGTTMNKHVKIQTLDPYFQNRQFRFRRMSGGATKLVSQAKFYGLDKGQLVDGLDALEMVSEMYSQVFYGIQNVSLR